MDLASCKTELAYTCGTAGAASLATALASNIMGDSCNGHATPYHLHVDPKCEYAPNADAQAASVTAHSPLVGVALDGRGLYGAWEAAGAAPSDLDACNGHTGPVPGTASVGAASRYSATAGITGLAASTVYHYHITSGFPHTVGCYGPVASTAACRVLYPATCNTWIPAFDASGGIYAFDDWRVRRRVVRERVARC
jgi:hypothetical protein